MNGVRHQVQCKSELTLNIHVIMSVYNIVNIIINICEHTLLNIVYIWYTGNRYYSTPSEEV